MNLRIGNTWLSKVEKSSKHFVLQPVLSIANMPTETKKQEEGLHDLYTL